MSDAMPISSFMNASNLSLPLSTTSFIDMDFISFSFISSNIPLGADSASASGIPILSLITDEVIFIAPFTTLLISLRLRLNRLRILFALFLALIDFASFK